MMVVKPVDVGIIRVVNGSPFVKWWWAKNVVTIMHCVKVRVRVIVTFHNALTARKLVLVLVLVLAAIVVTVMVRATIVSTPIIIHIWSRRMQPWW